MIISAVSDARTDHGHGNCAAGIPCGVHAWSTNGLDWSLPTIPAFGTRVPMIDGSRIFLF